MRYLVVVNYLVYFGFNLSKAYDYRRTTALASPIAKYETRRNGSRYEHTAAAIFTNRKPTENFSKKFD
ncbi:MAG: hypothetical protein RL115_474 [Bacteroidota bacterium]